MISTHILEEPPPLLTGGGITKGGVLTIRNTHQKISDRGKQGGFLLGDSSGHELIEIDKIEIGHELIEIDKIEIEQVGFKH